MGGERRPSRVFSGYIDTRRKEADPARDTFIVQSDGTLPVITRQWRFGDVDACLFEGDDVDAVPVGWRPEGSAEAPRGTVIGLVLAGELQVLQGMRRLDLQAGQVVIYDTAEPLRLRSRTSHRYLVAQVRPGALHLRDEDHRLVATRDLTAFASATALAALLRVVADAPDAPAPATGQHLGEAVVACLHSVVTEASGTVAGERSSALFAELVAWIDVHLGDDVSADRIATEHFLSARYVRKLFADHGTTVSTYVRRRRLERIRDELMQPWTAQLPVAAVAARWGFREPSVFSRAFTRQFGQGPQSFRREVSGGRPDRA